MHRSSPKPSRATKGATRESRPERVEAPAGRKGVEVTPPGLARVQSARNERAAVAARRASRHLQRESCSESSAWKPLGECMAAVMHVG